MQIHPSTAEDSDAIVAIYPQAFPDEDLVPLVLELLPDTRTTLSLVATIDDEIVGNVIFTSCGAEGGDARVALLAPLAVRPDCQRQGIGSALVDEGLKQLKEEGFGLVCVLGDPAYYSRLGFVPEKNVATPYPIPTEWADAWQSQRLGNPGTLTGKLLVPAQWQRPELWSE